MLMLRSVRKFQVDLIGTDWVALPFQSHLNDQACIRLWSSFSVKLKTIRIVIERIHQFSRHFGSLVRLVRYTNVSKRVFFRTFRTLVWFPMISWPYTSVEWFWVGWCQRCWMTVTECRNVNNDRETFDMSMIFKIMFELISTVTFHFPHETSFDEPFYWTSKAKPRNSFFS